MNISLSLAMDPMPTPRPRARIIAPKGRRPIVTMYSPKEYQTWLAEAAKLLAAVEVPGLPTSKPVGVEVEVHATKPKTTKLPHPKPDVDNYAKGILDAITKDGRFWADDSQVAELIVSKAWVEGPGLIRVFIREL